MASSVSIHVGVASGDFHGATSAALQAAVNACAEQGGGVVEVAAGTYILNDSLHLRSNVRVVGQGAATVLRKAPSATSALVGYLGYGHFDVSVAHPDLFPPGTGIHITDERSFGFYDTVATVTWRDGERLGLSRMLNHDYSAADGGRISSVFPLISGYHLRDASVEALTLDGNKTANGQLHGCRGGGVFLSHTERVTLRDLVVRDYNGDGISAQQCLDLMVEDCKIHGNTGAGLHPGSGSVGMIMRGLTICCNGRDGVYYCLRVSYSLLENCLIEDNGEDGISIGGRDTDHWIRANTVRGNARRGIHFRPWDDYMGAHRNLVEANRIGPNGTRSGEPEIQLEGITRDVTLLNNELTPDPQRSGAAIVVGAECSGIVVHGNRVVGAQVELLDAACAPDAIRTDPPTGSIMRGPGARPADAARHLRAEQTD